MSEIDTIYLRKLVATEQMDGEAISALIDEYERLRAQVADLTRIAGCVAISTEFSAIKNDLMPLPREYGTNPYSYVKDRTAVEVPVKTFDDIKREIKGGKDTQG